jgi:hypothetical protein
MTRLDFILQWTATVFTLVGAIAASCAIFPLNIWLLNAGTVAWLLWSIRQRSPSLIVVNAGMLTIYTVGALHAYLK